jgi:hypothetical protein
MRACYAPESVVRLSWFRGSGADFVTASEKMAGRGDASTHRLSPPVVHRDGDRALVELPSVVEIRTTVDDTEVDLLSFARLLYRVERRSGRWLVVSLDPVYERDTLTPSHPGTPLNVGPEAVAAYRPPYRFLAYVLTRRGYPIGDDLCGVDRPEGVTELYDSAFSWLRG